MASSTSSSSSTVTPHSNEKHGDLGKSYPSTTKLSKMRMVFTHSAINAAVLHHPYKGNGTIEDPYIVEWLPDDPRNPMTWPSWYKWFIAFTNAFSTLAIAFVSSCYAGGIPQIMEEFKVDQEIATLGISLFVLGFAIGPLFWAPLSELYGRQILFTITYFILTAFNAGAAASQNITTLLALRFLAAAFGSSPVTNSGGVIADMFSPEERGLAMTLFAVAPFMGPVLGPVVGSFIGITIGWRWLHGFLAIFTGAVWLFQTLTVPETYGPVLLRRRADKLTATTSKTYISVLDKDRGRPKLIQKVALALALPWILLIREPIVLLISLHLALIYGILYLFFGAVPIVFQGVRGWDQQIANLAFVAIAIGVVIGAAYNILDNKRYVKAARSHKAKEGTASPIPPELRLPPALIGSILLPISLFLFAWTSSPASIPWPIPCLALLIFGTSIILIFLAGTTYLIDTYTIFAASVLAANALLRSLFGAVFPMLTTYMYRDPALGKGGLGVNWASSLLGFLAVACMPFVFVFWKVGGRIRMKQKYSKQAHEFMEKIRASQREATMKKPLEAKRQQHLRQETEDDSLHGDDGESATVMSGSASHARMSDETEGDGKGQGQEQRGHEMV